MIAVQRLETIAFRAFSDSSESVKTFLTIQDFTNTYCQTINPTAS